MAESTTSKTVFFYGLFMDEDLLRDKGLEPKDFRLARVGGFGLRIGAKATLEPAEAEHVFGSVMTLRAEELERLYSDEGVEEYIPVPVTAFDMDENRIDATTYILPMEKLSGKNPEYASALLAVAKKLGIPEEYLKTVETWI